MKLAERLEDTLGGKWKGLYGEVVTEDCYRLRKLDFIPDLVFDIGANVGTFTRFARSLWPNAKIIAVEPHAENAAHFRKFTDMRDVELIEAAIGSGPVYRINTAANGAGEVYMSAGPGYPKGKIAGDSRFEQKAVRTVQLVDVIGKYWKGHQAIAKIDCEGAENHIFAHSPSMAALLCMNYVAMEIHRYAFDGGEQGAVNKLTDQALESFQETHHCVRSGVHFWARSKED